ncbi:histidine phosphatase family protein [Dyadobacter sp. CY356]|uniref:SixA phosphatase family protein n=1 Tax=Dyadobacter sp. CY356 TaxID=2906442 RepID=UPI001F4758B4|nr:histidine phosphatase family protein [Dyadobacter sp. CY356]MCF0058258.1 histidine phosphatase family protein [Dyadobacter sp. CY356]
MKRTLILVRHGAAEDQKLMVRDFERELVGKGKTDSSAMGRWLASKNIFPDRFISSRAARAAQTAVIMGDQLHFQASDIVLEDVLYDGGARGYLAVVNAIPAESEVVALFGHNPDITYFAEYLSGADLDSMSKGSLVIIEFDNLEWAEVSAKTGTFILYQSPKQLRDSIQ